MKLLTDEQIGHVSVTEEEVEEIEAEVLKWNPPDGIQYKQHFEWLFEAKLKTKAAQAQLDQDQAEMKAMLRT